VKGALSGLALFGPERPRGQCPFTGVERTSLLRASSSVDGPEADVGNALAAPKFMSEVMRDCV
jgi:hypothetical protein